MKNLLLLFLLLPVFADSQVITTIAGTGISGFSGDNGPATSAQLLNPNFTAFDRYGNLYYTDNLGGRVRKIDTAGIIITIAGTGATGYNGDVIPATAATLSYPEGIVCDIFGNVYIADNQNYRIRKVEIASGIITSIAGNGIAGDSGDGGPAIDASFTPSSIKFDQHGNLYISDLPANKVRMVNSAGNIFTFAGSGINGFCGDGGPATAACFSGASDLAIDNAGNVYVAEQRNARVRKINTSGIISTVAGTGLTMYNGDGIPATSANIDPCGILVLNNILYITTDSGQRIRQIDMSTGSLIHTIAGTGTGGYNGDGIQATSAQVNSPDGIVADSCGNLYFADANNYRIRKITLDTVCSSGALAVNKIKAAPVISVYPNPVSDIMHIDLGAVSAGVGGGMQTFCIRSIYGSVVLQGELREGSNNIPVSSLPAGMYMMEVRTCEERVVRKLLKE